MPSISRRRPILAVAAMAAALAVTATACGPSDDGADAKPSSSATQSEADDLELPKDLPTSLEDLKKWKDGAWQDWSQEDWLREAADFINPIIKDLWDATRMRDADEQERDVDDSEIDEGGENSGDEDQGVTDPLPEPVQAQAVRPSYHQKAAPVGKVFMDTPQGTAVCSGAVVEDPARPGKSNLVATAGHCVHAGKDGGWFRNIMFVPSYNDGALEGADLENADLEQLAPYGKWWAKWAQTTTHWIEEGATTGGSGAPQDFAVMHVQPEDESGKSLEEVVGSSLSINFDQPKVSSLNQLSSYGFPAAPPYDGERMFSCTDRPGRLTLDPAQPTMYQIGCTMTGGSSGGPWLSKGPDGKTQLFSVNSIGPADSTWLAGPRLGDEAKGVYQAISKKYAGQ